MKRNPIYLLLLAAVLVLPALATAHAYPEPAVVSPSWNLDVTIDRPQTIAVRNTGTGELDWYWYMPYKVVNNTGQEQLFIPEITIATDTGKIINTGDNVPASVFRKVRQHLGNDLLLSPIEIVGPLRQGEDFAKESVAIWPAFQEDVDEIRVFFSGLSGETQTIENPLTGEPVLMRRTLMIQYDMPGTPASPEDESIIERSRTDVMR
ncbi:MAG: hypothetical protein ACLFV3_11340 [Phycisphaeraceae bacterium]